MIVFQRLSGEGFGSIIDQIQLKLDYNGVTAITGEVGSGKTSIYSLLYWVIYGVPIKEKATVQTWAHLRPSTFRGTYGYVLFRKHDVSYEIIRCIDYKGEIEGIGTGGDKLIFKINGELTKTSGKREIQKEIVDTLGYSQRLFKSSVIFGQKLKRFSDEDGPTKNSIIEEIFEIDYINKAKSTSDELLSDFSSKLATINKSIVRISERIKSLKTEILNHEKYISEFESSKEIRKLDVVKQIKQTKLKITTAKGEMPDDPPTTEVVDNLRKLLISARNILKERDITISNINRLLEDKRGLVTDHDNIKKSIKNCRCTFCNSKIRDNGSLKSRLIKVKEELERVSKEIDKLESSLPKEPNLSLREKMFDSAKAKYDTYKRISALIKEYESNLAYQEKTLKNISEEKIEVDIDGPRTKLVKSNKKLNVYESIYKKLTEEVDDLKWISGVALSNKGLKSYIFSKLLHTLNTELKRLSVSIGFTPELGINEESARKEITLTILKGKHEVNFSDLSGGQGQLVNIVIAIACSNLINMGSRKTNILMLDEISEGLSNKALELFANNIIPLISDRSLYVITHRLSLVLTNCRNLSVKQLPNGGTDCFLI